MDETSFRAHNPPLPKSWSLRNKHNKHAVNGKGWSVTVYGAIGDCLVEPVFFYANSTNGKSYREFLTIVAGKVRGPADEKAFLLFDGHKAHHAALSKKLAKRLFHAFSTVP